jgi:hypothetical protein
VKKTKYVELFSERTWRILTAIFCEIGGGCTLVATREGGGKVLWYKCLGHGYSNLLWKCLYINAKGKRCSHSTKVPREEHLWTHIRDEQLKDMDIVTVRVIFEE